MVHIWDKVETREGVKYVVNMEHPTLELIEDRLDSDSRKLLRGYLETVQNSLPFNNLHIDMHNDTKILTDEENKEKGRVLLMARFAIKDAIINDHLEFTMEGFKTIEPYSNYIDEIVRICKEEKINGKY